MHLTLRVDQKSRIFNQPLRVDTYGRKGQLKGETNNAREMEALPRLDAYFPRSYFSSLLSILMWLCLGH